MSITTGTPKPPSLRPKTAAPADAAMPVGGKAWLQTLRASLSPPAPPQSPAATAPVRARLLSAGNDMPPGGHPQPIGAEIPNPGPGMREATAAQSAADEIARLAQQPGALDMDHVARLAATASNQARDAFQLAVNAAAAARREPGNAALAQSALEVAANATHAARAASLAHLTRLSLLHLQAAAQVAVDVLSAAEAANQASNDAIDNVASRLERLGVSSETVAGLRALKEPNAEALEQADEDNSAETFEAAIGEAEAKGDEALADDLTVALSVRSQAFDAADHADDARAKVAELLDLRTEALNIRAGLNAFDDGLQFQAWAAAAQDIENSAQAAVPLRESIHTHEDDVRFSEGQALRAARNAGLIPPATDAAALRVEQPPAGEPGEMVIGGTLVEIQPAEAAALADAGGQAGTAAREAIEDAAATHGTANPEAAHAAAKAGALEHSNALAKQILENPKVLDTLRGAGRVVTVAAVATMAVQLGKAIHTDALAGDKTAPATRKVLAELLGGVLGAEAGAIAGAAAGGLLGGALGSLVPVVGNAVGAFVGGIAGGLAGGISGWIGGSRQGQSLEHLVDDLIASEGKSDTPWVRAGSAAAAHDGAAIVKASGSEDDHVNGGELRQGLKALQLEVDIGDRQLSALINAYGSRGVGALSPADLDRALADGALRIDDQNQVTVEPLEFTLNLDTAGQEGRAANIAKRLVNLGSSDDGADRLLNTQELLDALEDAGCNRSIDKGRFARLVAAYGQSGEGALSEAEIADAIQDGALEFDAQGGVAVNDQGITGQAGDSAANIALRIVKASPGEDSLATADELKAGAREAGFDPELNDEDWQAMIAAHGDATTGLIGPEGIAQAIADGLLSIDAEGPLRLQPQDLAATSPPSP